MMTNFTLPLTSNMQKWYGVEIFAEKCSNFLEGHVFGNERRWRRFELSERFLRASAMLKHVINIGWTSVRLSVRPSVCPSVRPSHAGIVSKRLIILSCFLRHTIAHSF